MPIHPAQVLDPAMPDGLTLYEKNQHVLKGEEIPLAARIFAVADQWDALASDRPHRKA